ncbi:MAG: SDR family NAD(P)-dependent oxidoreductase, partial [Rhodocyclaceae bacterium]|nr:SDR family NAD(P)-dependent oxidoreductase [Rhodocyclaceae bacterium]
MNPKITDWQGKRVWLVGASAGIGAALAQELAKRGARLALSARNEEKLRALNIPDALILPCDATEVASLERALHHLLVQFWGVDLVIYLAGDYVPMCADNFYLAQAEKVIEVNFLAAMRLTATVLPHLRTGSGIAFVASVAGYR